MTTTSAVVNSAPLNQDLLILLTEAVGGDPNTTLSSSPLSDFDSPVSCEGTSKPEEIAESPLEIPSEPDVSLVDRSPLAEYQCKLCFRRHSSSYRLKVHQRLCHDLGNPFKCPHCTIRFRFEKALDRHVLLLHKLVNKVLNNDVDELVVSSTSSSVIALSPYECTTAVAAAALSENNQTCSNRRRTVSGLSSMEDSKAGHNNDKKDVAFEEKRTVASTSPSKLPEMSQSLVTCEICDKVLPALDTLLRHMRAAHGSVGAKKADQLLMNEAATTTHSHSVERPFQMHKKRSLEEMQSTNATEQSFTHGKIKSPPPESTTNTYYNTRSKRKLSPICSKRVIMKSSAQTVLRNTPKRNDIIGMKKPSENKNKTVDNTGLIAVDIMGSITVDNTGPIVGNEGIITLNGPSKVTEAVSDVSNLQQKDYQLQSSGLMPTDSGFVATVSCDSNLQRQDYGLPSSVLMPAAASRFVLNLPRQDYGLQSSVLMPATTGYVDLLKKQTLICSICNLKVLTREQLSDHLLYAHTRGRKFTCEQCKIAFTLAHTVQTHNFFIHGVDIM